MVGHHGHGHGESPIAKFFIGGTVTCTFELMGGHYLEFLKIAKQTSNLSYAQLTRNMVQHKGIIGVLDGFFPWGFIQCFVKGASFGLGQAAGYNMLKDKMPDFYAEIASGGIGGGVQGLFMSPLLLLKTRVMTMPEMRQSGGIVSTTIASSRIGVKVIREEGVTALFKGCAVFSSKRVLDWTSRFFFAEVCSDLIKDYKRSQLPESERANAKIQLSNAEKSVASLLGGALSATATIPMDVLVATIQDASKAGQKVSALDTFREKLQQGGVKGLIAYSSRGYVARVAHVALTTFLMKTVSTVVYNAINSVKTDKKKEL